MEIFNFCKLNYFLQNIPTQHYQNPRSAQALNHTPNRYQPRPGPSHQYQYPPQMPRYHSEESLPSKMGLYSSRIHSSADEISSINRSPSELSSSDESFSRTDFSRDEDGESPSPPSRPRSHAPWIYPSDIQIDPSSLEVSPKLQHMEFPDGNANESDPDPLRDLRMPSIGASPSTFNSDREASNDLNEDQHDEQQDDDDDQSEQDLRSRLNLPPGVTGAESCRSASPGDIMTDSYRGDSCGSFEFLTRSSRRTSSGKNQESEDEDQLFFPQRNEEKVAILRQIQSLNEGHTTEESRESSVVPEVNLLESEVTEDENPRQVESQVLEEIQKSIQPPPIVMAPVERSIPLVVAVADAARNPRIRGKPSRLRDLQQPVPMEENPQEESNATR